MNIQHPTFNFERIKRDIARYVERQRDMLTDLVQRLVEIPSENTPPGGGEYKAQIFIRRFCGRLPVQCRLVDLKRVRDLPRHPAYMSGRDYAGRPNFIARLKGNGPGRSLLLSGHVDTMPVGDAAWSRDPFGGAISRGRLYGRGAYDMKGGLAAQLMALKCLTELGIGLKGDLLFESVVDEEHAGCNGTLANRLIGHNADAAILAEPTNMRVYPAHKGFRIIHLTIKGKSGMSFGGEQLVNPVEHVGRLISAIGRFRDLRRKKTRVPPIYRDDPDPVPVFMPKLQAGEFSYRAPMCIPDRCKLEVYWQTMPGESQAKVEREFFSFLRKWRSKDAFFKQDVLEWSFSHRWLPGTGISAKHELVQTVKINSEHVLRKTVPVQGAPYPCDLFIFNLYGRAPALALGPGGGNAHGADEFVNVRDLTALARIYAGIAVDWCGVA